MAYAKILRGFGWALLMLAAAMLAPFAIAEGAERDAYGFALILTAAVGGCAWWVAPGEKGATGFREALALVLLWWFGAPVFAGLPFLFEGFSLDAAYFEAVSALTTTGGWFSGAEARSSAAAMVWRASLQWLGGIASIGIAAALLVRPEFTGVDTAPPPFALGERGSRTRALRLAIYALAPVYALLTAAAFLALWIAGAPAIDALVMALSASASGGFAPREGGIAAYGPAAAATLFPFMVASGLNFIVIARFARLASRARTEDMETTTFLVLAPIVGLGFFFSTGAGGLSRYGESLFNAASAMSTSGHLIGEAPYMLTLVTAVIGGAAVSTAGGVKLLRWLVLFRRTREEIWRLIEPRGVLRRARSSEEFGVWILFIAFSMALGVLVLFIGVYGHSFELAAAAATAALSNAGPLVALGGQGADYQMFSPLLRLVLALAMILGRLEAVAALAVINRAFWRS